MAYYYNGRFTMDINTILDEIVNNGAKQGYIVEYKTDIARKIPFTLFNTANADIVIKTDGLYFGLIEKQWVILPEKEFTDD